MINKHKKLISLLLVVTMLCSLSVSVFATTDYTTGTNVTYNPADPDGIPNSGDEVDLEAYTITVPAALKPNQSGTVTLHGTWASNRIVTVTSDTSVELTNSIDANNKKTLTVTFAGISEAGSNTEAQTFTETVAVGEITNALFGTWSGKFNYNVEINNVDTNALVLEGDGQIFHKMAPSTLTFRSTAPLDEFQTVLINGEPLDESAYTLTEGSTIVTLNIDYLETLDVDTHEITVVSDSGAPSAGFDVVEPGLNDYGFYYNQPYTAYVDAFNCKLAVFVRTDGTLDIINVDNGVPDTYSYEKDGNTIIVTLEEGAIRVNISADGMELVCDDLGVTFFIGDDSIVADDDYIYIYDSELQGYVANTINRRQSSYGDIKTGINGRPTVKLADFMFEDNENFVMPKTPATVTIWGEYLFSNCKNLTSIEIPDSVTTLEGGIFSGCENLKTIKIGSGLHNIEDYSFWGSYNLNQITVSPENEKYHSSGNCLIETNTKTLVLGSNSSTIPSDGSVKIIGRYAFLDCINMTSIVIPNGIEEIKYGAFTGCSSLTKIEFNGTVLDWENITKDDAWIQRVPATEVVCSDGIVTLK